MKALRTFFAIALAACTTGAVAQTETYEFHPHPFFGLQGGLQYTDGKAKATDLLSPGAQLSVGYQFSPVVAARLQVSGLFAKGGWSLDNTPALPKDYTFNYAAPGIDLMFNLSDLFCGYSPKRFFSVTAFVGGGANIAWGNSDAKDIAAQLTSSSHYQLDNVWSGTKMNPYGRGGLLFGFRLSDALQLNIEGNANVISDQFNSKKASKADWYYNALIGLRINLGKTYTAHKAQPVQPTVTRTKAVDEQPAKPVKPVKPATNSNVVKPATDNTPVAPATAKKAEPLMQNIFFDLNKSILRDDVERAKVKAIADYLRQHPAARVTITGYADAQTGTDGINNRLSSQRASTVAKSLTDDYGIAASRITTASKGASEQPFSSNDENRVAICVAKE